MKPSGNDDSDANDGNDDILLPPASELHLSLPFTGSAFT